MLKTTDPLADRSGEGTFLVTEELALEKVTGNRSTVDRDILQLGSPGKFVNRVGDNFFSGSAFPGDENGSIGAGNPTNQFVDVLHRR